MVPTIHVDDKVMAELKKRGNGRNPNEVIRELLGLPVKVQHVAEPAVYLVPHAQEEFESINDLKEFLSKELKFRGGWYYVASVHYWRNVSRGSMCLFQKNKTIIGEGKLLSDLMPNNKGEKSPVTGMSYEGRVQFDPASIKIYARGVPFDEAERIVGKTLTWRGVQKLTMEDYSRIGNASQTYPVLIPDTFKPQ